MKPRTDIATHSNTIKCSQKYQQTKELNFESLDNIASFGPFFHQFLSFNTSVSCKTQNIFGTTKYRKAPSIAVLRRMKK
jgi:hypothetical protein